MPLPKESDNTGFDSISLHENEENAQYEERMLNELMELREQGNVKEIASRILGLETFRQQSGARNDPAYSSAGRVISRFFDKITEISRREFTFDEKEKTFISDLSEELGRVSAHLRVQNGKDILEVKKLINDGAIPGTESLIGKDKKSEVIAGAIVNGSYHNAKKLRAIDALMRKFKNRLNFVPAEPELPVESAFSINPDKEKAEPKDTSISPDKEKAEPKDISTSPDKTIDEDFRRGAYNVTYELKDKEAGEYKGRENELFCLGEYKSPSDEAEQYGYVINNEADLEDRNLFSKVPDEQIRFDYMSAEEITAAKVGKVAELQTVQDYGAKVKEIAEMAKIKLQELDAIQKKGHNNSTEYKNMRDALVAVTQLNQSKSPAQVKTALETLRDTSAEYYRTRNVWYRSFKRFGQDRLAASSGINDWCKAQILNAEELERRISDKGISFENGENLYKKNTELETEISELDRAIERKEIKPEELEKKRRAGKEKIDYHKKRVDLRHKDKAAVMNKPELNISK